MGTTAARKCRMILDNAQKVIGIELAAARQALWLRSEEGRGHMAPATKAVYDLLAERIAPIETDVVMYPNLKVCDELIKAHAIVPAAEAVCGALK